MKLKAPNRYIILISASIVGLLTGSPLAYSIFRNPLMAAHGWSASQVTLAYSLFMMLVLVGTFLGGPLQKKVCPTIIVFVGGIMQGAGFMLAGCVNSLPMLYFCFSFIGGMGAGFLYGTAVGTATKWFPDKAGFANGFCIGCMGLAPAIFAPLGNAIITQMDVFASFKVMGFIMIVLYGSVAWFIKAPPQDWLPEGYVPQAVVSGNSVRNYTTREMLSTPLYWVLLMAMICSLCSGVMLTGQASAVAQFNASLNAAQGAMMTAILAVFSCVGRLGLGTLSDKVGRYNLYLIILFVTALDMIFVFNSAHTFGAFLLALAPPALGFGGMMAMLPGLAADNFGPQNFSVNYPFLFTAYTLCSLVGPMLASFVLELDGNYDRAMVFAGILAVIGFVLVLVAKGLSREMAVNATMPE